MRFNLRQLLATVAFVALIAAYVGQSIRYRNLDDKYYRLEQRYSKAKECVKNLADISIEDKEDGPNRYTVSLEVPKDWPAGLKDEWKEVTPGDYLNVMISRMAGDAR
jgi:hypothetical protein